MCGRYSLVRGNKIVEVIPNVTMPANLRLVERYNLAPTQLAPVIANDSHPPQLQLFRWGLIPPWAKDEKIGNRMINARAETLAEKPAFRKALADRRCLIPADGFYEWRKDADGSRTPLYLRMKDGGLFAFAGLWETWRNPAGEEVRSFTIITTAANELVKPIHDRMPAIIPREGYLDWLEHGGVEWLRPFPAEEMCAYPVRPLVNSPGNEGRELVEPVADEKPEVRPREIQAKLFE